MRAQHHRRPGCRDRVVTNRGLRRCIADRIPVGALRGRAHAGGRSQYDVLGLAMPVMLSDGYFFFESLASCPGHRPGEQCWFCS